MENVCHSFFELARVSLTQPQPLDGRGYELCVSVIHWCVLSHHHTLWLKSDLLFLMICGLVHFSFYLSFNFYIYLSSFVLDQTFKKLCYFLVFLEKQLLVLLFISTLKNSYVKQKLKLMSFNNYLS